MNNLHTNTLQTLSPQTTRRGISMSFHTPFPLPSSFHRTHQKKAGLRFALRSCRDLRRVIGRRIDDRDFGNARCDDVF
jgi:hypothetical protein